MGKLCLCLNICFIGCLIILAAMAFSFFHFVVHVGHPETDGCTRETAPELVECVNQLVSMENYASFNNSSDTVLQHPREYQKHKQYCDESYECLQKIRCKKIREKFRSLPGCSFAQYYTDEFSGCAEQLYEKKDEIDCLGEIYNIRERTDEATCDFWKDPSTMKCLKSSIETVCGDRLGIQQLKFEKFARQGDVLFCGSGSRQDTSDQKEEQKLKN